MGKFVCVLLALLLLTGCGAAASEPAGEPENTRSAPAEGAPSLETPPSFGQDAAGPGTVVFTDDLGREVTVTEPKRVAALLGSFADVWLLAGGEVCATADDAWEDLDLPLGEDVTNLGNIKSLSLELLLAAKPDFILASANTRQHLEWRETLEKTGIPTAYFDVPDFAGYLRLLGICARITGNPALYETYGTDVEKQIEAVRAAARAKVEENGAPRVLVLRASPSIIQAKNSTGNVLGELLADLGCENIADQDDTLLETLSLEHILQADPQFVFIVQRGGDVEGTRAAVDSMLAGQPAWQSLAAAKQEHVYYMDKSLFSMKPNARWGEAYETVGALLWPEDA